MNETNQIIGQLGALSYFGSFIVSILANVIVPVPEEIVLLAFGYLAGAGHLNVFILIPIIMAGLLISDIAMYTLSKKGNKLVTHFYDKFFAPRLAPHKEWLDTHIHKVIFFSRFMIQLRFLGPFLAGQNQVPFKRFIKYDFLAILVYVPLFVGVGFLFRERIEFIISGVGLVKNIIIMVVALLVLIAFSKLMNDLIFGPYTLSLHGTKEQRTWIPWIYKIRK